MKELISYKYEKESEEAKKLFLMVLRFGSYTETDIYNDLTNSKNAFAEQPTYFLNTILKYL